MKEMTQRSGLMTESLNIELWAKKGNKHPYYFAFNNTDMSYQCPMGSEVVKT